jgi:hypothetical protein
MYCAVVWQHTPAYKLAKMFSEKIKTYIPLPYAYNVKNTVQFIEDLSDILFDPNLKLASFDITNMYTNIPTEKLLNIINIMCDNYNMENTLKQEILRISGLIIAQNCFKFQDTVYLQKDDLAMGALTSSIFSEIFLQYNENTEIYDILLNSKVEGYLRYVDDILIVYKENHANIKDILDLFNNVTPGLHFTLEQE